MYTHISDDFQRKTGVFACKHNWDGIFKILRSLVLDSKESIPPAYVACRAGTTNLFLRGSYPP